MVSSLLYPTAPQHAALSPEGTSVVTASNDTHGPLWMRGPVPPLTPALEHRRAAHEARFRPRRSDR